MCNSQSRNNDIISPLNFDTDDVKKCKYNKPVDISISLPNDLVDEVPLDEAIEILQTCHELNIQAENTFCNFEVDGSYGTAHSVKR